MKLLIKFPTRQRPKKFLETLDLYIANINDDNYEIIISADIDDESMNNYVMREAVSKYKNCSIYYGNNTSKIEAVNADMNICNDWDILLLTSDDMIPMCYGFDDVIRNEMKARYPECNGALWFNDGKVDVRLNTIVCCGKKYYDRFGYLYHPDYKSLWSDNEYTEVGQQLGLISYIDKVIIQHNHPAWDKDVPNDDLYRRNDKFWDHDKAVYQRRKAINFEL